MFMTGSSCLVVFVITLLPVFSKPQYKWLRGCLFLALGLSIGAPLFYIQRN